MTFFAAVLDGVTGEMTYANASHDMPILFRGSKQRLDQSEPKKEYFDSLDHHPDPCLGENLQTLFKEYKTILGPADSMILFTDGLIECRNPNREEFGERRLLRSYLALAGSSTAEIRSGLVESANMFFQKNEQEDDITLVVVKNVRHSHLLSIAG
jgi:sigma-B regulation protein RsbU (phosphoserine phosphatase)